MIERASVLSAARSSSKFLIYLICLLWIGIHPLNKISSSTAWCNVYMTLSAKLMIGLYQVWMIFFPSKTKLSSGFGEGQQPCNYASEGIMGHKNCSIEQHVHIQYQQAYSWYLYVPFFSPDNQSWTKATVSTDFPEWSPKPGSLGLRDGIPSANLSKGAALTVVSKSQRIILWASWETILVQNL